MTATHGEGVYGNAAGVTTPLDHKMAQLGHVVKTAANTIRPGLFWDGSSTVVSGKANMSYDVRAFACVMSRGATAGAVFLTNDAVYNVTTTAAPGSNSRYDVVYIWQREYALDGTDSTPVIGVVQGTAAASPTVPSLSSYPGAIELARILVPSGVTATNSGTTITQTAPFTALDGGTFPVRNTTELAALGSSYLQGQKVRVLATDVVYAYCAAFDATTNPAGAKTAGWYPTPDGASFGGNVVRGSGTLTLSAGDNILGGTNVWSATASGAAKENGVAAFATPSWTVPIEGVYRVTFRLYITTAATAIGLVVKKGNTSANFTGHVIGASAANAGGVALFAITDEVELAASDTLTVDLYLSGAGATITTSADDMQFGIEFVRPIRHA